MNTSHGWVKLYRCLLDDAACQKSAYFHLWVTLLLMAAHKEHEFIFNNQIQKLQPGQLITGRKKLSKLTGISETTVRRILKCFENGHMVQRKVTTKYTVITITNWENYQCESSAGHHGGQQMASKRPASDQQATNKRPHTRMKRISL
jgi:DNA replication protein DnaD